MIIDMHVHCGHQFFPMRTPDEGILSVMDRFGLDVAIISSADGIYYDYRGCNEALAQLLDTAPGRLYGYVVVNPNYPEDALSLIERYARRPGFVGVKLHASWHNQPIDGPAFAPIFALCERFELPVLIHSYVVDDYADQVSSPERIMRVAKRHHNPLIIAHMGGNHRRMLRAVLEGGNPPHVYTDISTGRERASQQFAWTVGRVEEVVRGLGVSKVLFGTDFPPLDPAISLGMMEDAALTPGEKECIFFRNAAQLFGIAV